MRSEQIQQDQTGKERTSDGLSLWKESLSLPASFDSDKYMFAVSGFRNDKLFENPLSLVDPYYGSLFGSVIGKSESLTPDKNGNKWRLGTFRPWGVILQLEEPQAIMELRDHDPGPPEVETRTPSLRASEVSPLQLLEATALQNEFKLKLDRRKPTVKISGFFCFSDELESVQSKKLQVHARAMSLPFIVIDKVTGTAKVMASTNLISS